MCRTRPHRTQKLKGRDASRGTDSTSCALPIIIHFRPENMQQIRPRVSLVFSFSAPRDRDRTRKRLLLAKASGRSRKKRASCLRWRWSGYSSGGGAAVRVPVCLMRFSLIPQPKWFQLFHLNKHSSARTHISSPDWPKSLIRVTDSSSSSKVNTWWYMQAYEYTCCFAWQYVVAETPSRRDGIIAWYAYVRHARQREWKSVDFFFFTHGQWRRVDNLPCAVESCRYGW